MERKVIVTDRAVINLVIIANSKIKRTIQHDITRCRNCNDAVLTSNSRRCSIRKRNQLTKSRSTSTINLDPLGVTSRITGNTSVTRQVDQTSFDAENVRRISRSNYASTTRRHNISSITATSNTVVHITFQGKILTILDISSIHCHRRTTDNSSSSQIISIHGFGSRNSSQRHVLTHECVETKLTAKTSLTQGSTIITDLFSRKEDVFLQDFGFHCRV